MTENLLRVRGDRLDLGYIDGDVLEVVPAIAAQPGQIVITTSPDGTAHVDRYDGTGHVRGLVLHMYRRVLRSVS